MHKDFLVVWHDVYEQRHVDVVSIAHPPHEPPRGGVLDELIQAGVVALNPLARHFSAAIELGNAAQSPGAYRELAVGDGRVASLECTGGEWRVHL